MDERNNIVLIGMPGAGKSTLGVMLAKALVKDFIDTDVLLQQRAGSTLQQIIGEQGVESFRSLEGDVLLDLQCENTVISTGGSAVYAADGMAHLREGGIVIFIDVPLEVLQQRIHNMDTRGIVQQPGQSFADLYNERRPRYQAFADIHIDAGNRSQNEVLATLLASLKAFAQEN